MNPDEIMRKQREEIKELMERLEILNHKAEDEQQQIQEKAHELYDAVVKEMCNIGNKISRSGLGSNKELELRFLNLAEDRHKLSNIMGLKSGI